MKMNGWRRAAIRGPGSSLQAILSWGDEDSKVIDCGIVGHKDDITN
jgi:hypothetical protein